MNFPVPFHATGGLFTLIGDYHIFTQIEAFGGEGIETSKLTTAGWLAVFLHSNTPLISEIEPRANGYTYCYLLRESGARKFLLVSSDSKLVEVLLEKIGLKNRVTKPVINISNMVAELCREPAEYSMGAVYARIEGFGQALRSAAFYGSDIGEAILFRQILGKLSPHRVMLRHVARRREVLSASYSGDIGFIYQGASTLREADEALRFLSKRGYLDWNSETPTNTEDSGAVSDGSN